MNTQRNENALPLWKLIALCMSAGFAALLPANALGGIATLMHISTAQASGVLAYFLLGYGLAPLAYGPLADHWGRRTTLITGFTLGAASALLSLLALAFHQDALLNLARLGEGLGSGVGLVMGMLMLSDTAAPAEARKYFSYVMLVFALAPVVAMSLSGWMMHTLGTPSIFEFTGVLMLFWLGISFSLKETQQGPRIPLHVGRSLMQYARLFKHPAFVAMVLIASIGSIGMYLFNGLAPLLANTRYLISPERFGLYNILPSAGLLIGSMVSARLAHRVAGKKMILLGLGLLLAAGAIMLLLMHSPHSSILSLMLPSILLFAGSGFILGNAAMTAINLTEAGQRASASALTSALPMSLSGLGVHLTSSMHGYQVLPLSLSAIGLAGFLLFAASRS